MRKEGDLKGIAERQTKNAHKKIHNNCQLACHHLQLEEQRAHLHISELITNFSFQGKILSHMAQVFRSFPKAMNYIFEQNPYYSAPIFQVTHVCHITPQPKKVTAFKLKISGSPLKNKKQKTTYYSRDYFHFIFQLTVISVNS